MSGPLHIRTQVLAGGRVELSDPELAEGEVVDVVVTPIAPSLEKREAFVRFLRGLPSNRTLQEWEQFERYYQTERDSWER